MVVCKQFVVLSMVVELLATVDVRNDDGGDDEMNGTRVPDGGQRWAMFALLPRFDTFVDDPEQTEKSPKQTMKNYNDATNARKATINIHHYGFQISR